MIVIPMEKKETYRDLKKIRRAVLTLSAANHPIRKKIMEILIEDPGLSVTSLWIRLARTTRLGFQRNWQSVTSQHLARLRREGYVTYERRGKNVHYYFNQERWNEVIGLCKKYA